MFCLWCSCIPLRSTPYLTSLDVPISFFSYKIAISSSGMGKDAFGLFPLLCFFRCSCLECCAVFAFSQRQGPSRCYINMISFSGAFQNWRSRFNTNLLDYPFSSCGGISAISLLLLFVEKKVSLSLFFLFFDK